MADKKDTKTQSISKTSTIKIDKKPEAEKSSESEKKPKERITAKQFAKQQKLGIGIYGLIENWLGRTKCIAFPHTVKKTVVEWQRIWIKMNKEKA